MLSRVTVLLSILLLGAQTITITPRYRVGDEFTLEVTHSLEDSTIPDNGFEARSTVHVKVSAPTRGGWWLDWQPQATEIHGNPLGPELAMAVSMRLLDNIHFEFAIASSGEFVTMTDSAGLMASLTAASLTLKAPGQTVVSPALRSAIDDELLAKITPETLGFTAVEQGKIYTDFASLSMKVGEILEQPLSRNMGMTRIPGVCQIRLESATADAVVVLRHTVLDTNALKDHVAALRSRNGTPVAPAEVGEVGMSEEARYVFDRVLGLTRELRFDRIATRGPDRRLERFTMRMTKPPKR